MLIGLVRDSVMQCFCHTCRAPILPAVNRRSAPTKKPTKARTKQPKASKKVKFITTEIRCQEKSKGGLCYEVILAEPAINVIVPKLPPTPGKPVSAEEIDEKLKAAEERRLSLEAKKMADWSAKMAKIEEATRKKDELDKEFKTHAKETLDQKMEQYEEKREAQITELKEKLKMHAAEIEKTRHSLEHTKSEELKMQLEDKLRTAASLRDDKIKKILDRLKEHNTEKIKEVRTTADLLETQKTEEKTRIIENKLSTAEQNREKELQKKLENIRKHERRAEIVRQNKAALSTQKGDDNSVTASSG
ncbi:GYF domain-containing protein gyf-1 isoform X1 [Wyeomyia smithii]|uniref:GYF domain-containing protein gyf-1 isoform X1 n=1 Tax=Wyeomyia smithii TaxID=174621 RepID=UPI002467B9F7|nr:GYF domain-containing protein gyf-1 isoform X1 [Wyeomyia smithii]XP_055547696.1 GYF domain-containing protein gyf-1 isoform X1 [Wyeomyia smithii]XP_055547697.1 GYF domain-containing protein gyf-1 isoform X1 [Wyeomyia smithii]XP_055547698.1 GYF domain-containing protein gyf-1 isoform X1 [Wyeomyia smithii]